MSKIYELSYIHLYVYFSSDEQQNVTETVLKHKKVKLFSLQNFKRFGYV